VIPLRVEKVEPRPAFLYELATRQWIDYFADPEQALRTLGDQLAQLGRALPKEVRDAKSSAEQSSADSGGPKPAQPVRGSWRPSRRMIIAVSFALALLIGVAGRIYIQGQLSDRAAPQTVVRDAPSPSDASAPTPDAEAPQINPRAAPVVRDAPRPSNASASTRATESPQNLGDVPALPPPPPTNSENRVGLTKNRADSPEEGSTVVVLRHDGQVTGAEFSPDGGRIVTQSWDRTARLFEAATGTMIAILRGHEGSVLSSFNSKGTQILTESGKQVRVWNGATGKLISTIRGDADLRSAAWSPDGTRIVTTDCSSARVWDIATNSQLAVMTADECIDLAAFSHDGMRLVTTDGKTARVWDASTYMKLAALIGHGDGPQTYGGRNELTGIAFSPNDRVVATSSYDQTARLWEAASGRNLGVLRHEDGVWSAAFSPDGTRIVTAASDSEKASVWDVRTAKEIVVLVGHEGTVRGAQFSPNGRQVVTASHDGTARVWDAATGEELGVLRHGRQVWSAAFNPQGTRIVTASADGSARVWPVP
jgi:WD40 repeat protein